MLNAIEPETPDWVRDAIFYQIFPDRFASSLTVPKPAHLDQWGAKPTWHGYQGGDLVGVVERLDYLADLGVNAVYFTPIFQSASNHRYHTHDYEKVDPMLGGNSALHRLIDAAHARNIKVVLDGVFNHAGRGFFQFHDILENGANSAYLDWFTVNEFPLNAYDTNKAPTYKAWWNLPALPKFNTDTPAVREYLWNIGREWVEFGIDGWRLDVANEIDDEDFWREFRRRVRAVNPEAYIVGEVWIDSTRWLNNGDMWDAVMNYQLTKACLAYFIGPDLNTDQIKMTSLYPVGPSDVETFKKNIERLLALYPWNVTCSMLNILGSHDTARFLTIANGDTSALKLATLFQMTYPGAPSIYYGDEIGMAGGHDPANRGAFPWHHGETWNLELLHEFQRLIALRNAHPALRRGTFQTVHAADEVFAFARCHVDETIVVVLNPSKSTKRIDIAVADIAADGLIFKEAWSHDFVTADGGGLRDLKIPPRAGRVLIASRTH